MGVSNTFLRMDGMSWILKLPGSNWEEESTNRDF